MIERTVRKFSRFEEADRADRAYYGQLTPAERLRILLELTERHRQAINAPDEIARVIESLNSYVVEYVIMGAYALAFHARPRYTGNIDFLVRPTPENAERLACVLAQFGFGSLDLVAADFLRSDFIVQLGYPPNRIDLLTPGSGVSMDAIWNGRVHGEINGLPVDFIGRLELIENKRASDRAQDQADLDALGSVQ